VLKYDSTVIGEDSALFLNGEYCRDQIAYPTYGGSTA
jgi:hypothetical protein